MTDDTSELPPEKIRAICPKLPEDVWHAEPEQLQQLRDDIAALAHAENDEVFFYEPVENDAYDYGQLYIECSDSFADKIKNLPQTPGIDSYSGYPEIYRAGHAGVNSNVHLVAVELTVKGSALTKRAQIANLRSTLMQAARESGSDGDVLVQGQDLKKGALTLLCPPHFVTEIEAMEDAPAVTFLPNNSAPILKPVKNNKGFKP